MYSDAAWTVAPRIASPTITNAATRAFIEELLFGLNPITACALYPGAHCRVQIVDGSHCDETLDSSTKLLHDAFGDVFLGRRFWTRLRWRSRADRGWTGLEPYGDTLILTALALACFVNFGRNRTLHCGLTGPLFALAAIVAFLVEAEIWAVDQTILWAAVLLGVAVAFLVEWRTVGTQERGSNVTARIGSIRT
jgi:hypothetical protein